nr:MAG: replication initiation protein [Microvirus sp.]
MTCYSPLDAHNAGLTTSGKKLIKFGLPKSSGQESLQLPCGQCIGCRLARSQMWAVRCMHENQQHQQSAFITLTYDEEHLPHDNSLNPIHLQKFIRRYRKKYGKIRYLSVGEYGDKLSRPHYHAIIFGHEFTDTDIHSEEEGLITYHSPTLNTLWGKGYTTTGQVSIESAAYVARYCLKKITGDQKNAHYETTCQTTGEIRQLHPEFNNMSRRPGLALDWYKQFNTDIFPSDETVYQGKIIKTPRYYEKQLEKADPGLLQTIKLSRKAKALRHAADNTTDRLRQRHEVKLAQTTNLKRKLDEI